MKLGGQTGRPGGERKEEGRTAETHSEILSAARARVCVRGRARVCGPHPGVHGLWYSPAPVALWELLFQEAALVPRG